jgi:hypothetical protein
MSTSPSTNQQTGGGNQNPSLKLERLQTIFNGLLALFAFIGLIAGGYELYLLGQQLAAIGIQNDKIKEQVDLTKTANETAAKAATAAKTAADAAVDSNEISRKTAEQQLQAYLTIDKASIATSDNGTLAAIIMTLKNNGQTPAYGVKVISGSYYTDPPHAVSPVIQPLENYVPPQSIIGPGAEVITIAHLTITPKNQGLLLDQKRRLWISGTITYTDIFEHDRYTDFRFFGGRSNAVGPKKFSSFNLLLFATEGNQADKKKQPEKPAK